MTGPNPPYECVIIQRGQLTGNIPGKFYAAEIQGREDLSREWKHSGQNSTTVINGIEQKIASSNRLIKIPRIIIAMPHFTRVYSFGNPLNSKERETNINGELYDSKTFFSMASGEVGCDGEIAILGQEREFWNKANTVEAYLRMFVSLGSLGKVANPNKLHEFLTE